MHMDNPQGFATLIINDLLGENQKVAAPNEPQIDYQDEAMEQIQNAAENQQEEEEKI